MKYKLELSIDEEFSFVRTESELVETSFALPDSLAFDTPYWWRVSAYDKTDLYSQPSEVSHFWTWTVGDVDGDHSVSVADIAAIVDQLFGSGTEIAPAFAGDVDGDCDISVSDIAAIIDNLFGTGADMKDGCE